MKRLLLATALLLCSGGAPYADEKPEKPAVEKKTPAPDTPTLKIDAEVKPNGQYVNFLPDTNCVSVLYVGMDGIDPFPSSDLKDNRKFILDTRGLATGRYRFVAVGTSGTGSQVRTDFAVVVGTPVPVPPGPAPPPPQPVPTDLTATLQAAFNLDTDAEPDKATSLKTLTGLYQGLAVLATVKTDLHTNADALAWLSGVIQAPSTGLGTTKIQNTRKAIAARLSATFGNMPTTALDVKKFAAELKIIGDALAGVK